MRCLPRIWPRLGKLIDENFDTRRALYQLPAWQVEMVESARACGASAKFAGSGGAIVGIYEDEAMFDALSERLATLQVRTIKPRIVNTH